MIVHLMLNCDCIRNFLKQIEKVETNEKESEHNSLRVHEKNGWK